MTSTTTEVRPRGRPHVSLAWMAPAVLVLAACLLIVNLSGSMPARESITIDNRTGAPVTVRTTGAARDGWMGLTTVDPNSRTTVESVVDQGRTWWFRLSVGPDRLAEVRRTEDQMRAAGWKLTIPAGAVDRLPEQHRAG
jgi:hypothetical protein